MIRVTALQPAGLPHTLRVEGSLRRADVEELERAVRIAAEGDRPVVLDLAGVSFMDGEGAECIRRMHARGIELTGCNGLVGELLGLSPWPDVST